MEVRGASPRRLNGQRWTACSTGGYICISTRRLASGWLSCTGLGWSDLGICTLIGPLQGFKGLIVYIYIYIYVNVWLREDPALSWSPRRGGCGPCLHRAYRERWKLGGNRFSQMKKRLIPSKLPSHLKAVVARQRSGSGSGSDSRSGSGYPPLPPFKSTQTVPNP